MTVKELKEIMSEQGIDIVDALRNSIDPSFKIYATDLRPELEYSNEEGEDFAEIFILDDKSIVVIDTYDDNIVSYHDEIDDAQKYATDELFGYIREL